MQFRILVAILAVTATSSAFSEGCVDVIALSKTTAQRVQSREDFESHSKAFCSEAKNSSSAAKSTSYAASYKFISAAMNNANASESELTSKVCEAGAGNKMSSGAYAEYVTTINEKGYDAYMACEKARAAQVLLSISAMAKTQATIVLRNDQSSVNPVELEFDVIGSGECVWTDTGGPIVNSKKSLKTGASSYLKCSRKDISQDVVISITDVSNAKGISVAIPWNGVLPNGEPVDAAEKRAKATEAALVALQVSLKDAVLPFRTAACPDGWSAYAPAYGRFVRGIDPTSASKRAPSSLEEDAMQGHKHASEGNWFITDKSGKIQSGGAVGERSVANVGKPITDGDNGVPRIANETRPVNVALLYCFRS